MRPPYTSKFLIHKQRNGTYIIRLRITLSGQPPIDSSVGITLDTRSEWDDARQRIKARTPFANVANLRLNEIENKVSELMTDYQLVERKMPSVERLKTDIATILGKGTTSTATQAETEDEGDTDDIFHLLDIFRKQQGTLNQWTVETDKYFKVVQNHLHKFSSRLRLSELTDATLQDYIQYLTNQGFRNTYIAKHISLLRWFLRWASTHGYYNGTLHDTFRPRLKGANFEYKEIIYLTIDELKRIESFQLPPSKKYLDTQRDVFLFCCYTGLRYSDAARLTKSDIYDNYIEIVTKKTTDRLRIELNAHSRAILAKYAEADLSDNRALPAISNQKTNAFLKELGRICGIDTPIRLVHYTGNQRVETVRPKHELLSTHCARRTFVVTALQLGIPAEVIMKWTGHSDFKAMKPYVKIVDDLKARSMSRFDSL
ncbi:MAG: phage integrase SAM-like domain-containing protein [Bacteroidales bacterium]|nr:phage integrase SAM-like domain-containing protein [Bacteroidales bacterium]